jgi:glycosyltransferase involved in cell wall biosynthesis
MNRPVTVIEALDSIATQTQRPSQLIVVDDGSRDETPDRVAQWIADHDLSSWVRLVRQDNHGAAVARNRGVAEGGSCDVLAFLDSDDLWPTDYVARMTAALAAASDAVAAFCDKVVIEGRDQARQSMDLSGVPTSATQWMMHHGPTGTSNTVIRRTTFNQVGGFDASMPTGQDLDLMLQASLLGQWLHVPGEPVVYRHRYAETKGEAGALSHHYSDRRYRRAMYMEKFLFEKGGASVIDDRIWRRHLGAMWFKAGKQLAKLGRKDQARDCFTKAVKYSPGHLRARLRQLIG